MSQIRPFEARLYEVFENTHPELLKAILEEGQKGKLSDALKKKLLDAVAETRDGFLRLREAS
jgi:hypothetical protein